MEVQVAEGLNFMSIWFGVSRWKWSMVDWYCIAYIGVDRGWEAEAYIMPCWKERSCYVLHSWSIFFHKLIGSGLPLALAPWELS